MKIVIIFLMISLILLSGCTAQVVQTSTEKEPELSIGNEPTGSVPTPQVTATQRATEETKISTVTVTEITEAPEKTTLPEPKTFQVNIVEGIGIREGSG